MAHYSSVSNGRGEVTEEGVLVGQFSTEGGAMSLIEGGANRRGCSCRLIFNTNGAFIEGGMHVSKFAI